MTVFSAVARTVGVLAGIGFAACALTPLPNIAAGLLAEANSPMAAGAVVVLGADIRPDGTLGDSSLRRTITGIQQYYSDPAQVLVFTGSGRSDGLSEARARLELAKELTVPEVALVIAEGAMTTREEALRVKAVLGPKGINDILIVTDSLHLRRARLAFERQGFRVGGIAADTVSLEAGTPEDRLKLTRLVLQQAAALLYYQVAN